MIKSRFIATFVATEVVANSIATKFEFVAIELCHWLCCDNFCLKLCRDKI